MMAWPPRTSNHAASVFNPQEAAQDEGDLLEGGPLTGLGPTGGTSHVRDTKTGSLRIDVANILVNALAARDGDLRRGWN